METLVQRHTSYRPRFPFSFCIRVVAFIKRTDRHFFTKSIIFFLYVLQGVTQRCRLSCWTIALSYTSPNAGGWGASANEHSCAHHVTWDPNKLYKSTSIFNRWSPPAYGIVYRIIGGFLYAATSSLRRVTGRIVTITECFQRSKPKLYLVMSS